MSLRRTVDQAAMYTLNNRSCLRLVNLSLFMYTHIHMETLQDRHSSNRTHRLKRLDSPGWPFYTAIKTSICSPDLISLTHFNDEVVKLSTFKVSANPIWNKLPNSPSLMTTHRSRESGMALVAVFGLIQRRPTTTSATQGLS